MERLKEVCELGKSKDFETLIALQPFLDPNRKPLAESEQNQYESLPITDLVSSYQLYATELDELKKYCTDTADLRDVYNGVSDPLYYDMVHGNDNGNKIIADKIFEIILPIVKEHQLS